MLLPTIPRPGLLALAETAKSIVRNFDDRRFVYLTAGGGWKENPKSLRDRAAHELLHELAKQKKEGVESPLEGVFFPLASEKTWPLCLKIWAALGKNTKRRPGRIPKSQVADGNALAFRVLFEIVVWKTVLESLQLNSRCFVRAWDNEARSRQMDCARRLKVQERFLDSVLTPQERAVMDPTLDEIRRSTPPLIDSVSCLLAEEENYSLAISRLLRKTRSAGTDEESLPLIAEKILPSEGVVTNTSPALLRPCLQLLLNKEIDILSGVPYYASIVLSILKDPRTARGLLQALDLYPVTDTKIRENIIYTLGMLREGLAVEKIAAVLEKPDEVQETTAAGEKSYHPLREQKEEAIWALGKIGYPSVKKLSLLAGYADHPSLKLKTYLAWTLGEIGKAQKETLGGVGADVVIALLKLLKTKNKQVFEESASGLKKIGMPEFIHSLYLYHAGAISILGLKPAQRGLYELSETLHYLIHSKTPTIIAVNGDSGTGKTYFCQALMGGFGGIKPDEILYLMRDRKKGQTVFNRLLGIKWLKKYIEPAYYHDYPCSEEEDNPDEYFRQFLAANADKKLIILDGARDSLYFQKVIDYFYGKGELDVEVNFRANFSTRRLNLEEREMALESVKTHLAFLEEPTLEDTLFYQEGVVALYDLDNSAGSRLNAQEIRELFETRRIESWGNLIRVGDFKQEPQPLEPSRAAAAFRDKDFSTTRGAWNPGPSRSFLPHERNFKAVANDDLNASPNLLQRIDLGDLRAERIRFYAQDQIAGIGEGGKVFVLTFLDNRIFETTLDRLSGIALLGRDIYVVNNDRELIRVSFEKNEITLVAAIDSPILEIAAFPRHTIATGHGDGSIRLWNISTQEVMTIEGNRGPVQALAMDYSGRVYAANHAGGLKRWDLEKKCLTSAARIGSGLSHIRLCPQGKILCLGTSRDRVSRTFFNILDFDRQEIHIVSAELGGRVKAVHVYFDGRILAGLSSPTDGLNTAGKNLVVVSNIHEKTTDSEPAKSPFYQIVGGHGIDTRDCLTMGPKIISCGSEAAGRHSLRIWGTEFYVRMELGKLAIQGSGR